MAFYLSNVKRCRCEKISDRPLVYVLVIDLLIVDSKFAEQRLVVARKRSGIDPPIIPNQNHVSARAKNASEFVSCLLSLEPVEGLAGDDQIDGAIGKCGVLRGSIRAVKPRIAGKLL